MNSSLRFTTCHAPPFTAQRSTEFRGFEEDGWFALVPVVLLCLIMAVVCGAAAILATSSGPMASTAGNRLFYAGGATLIIGTGVWLTCFARTRQSLCLEEHAGDAAIGTIRRAPMIRIPGIGRDRCATGPVSIAFGPAAPITGPGQGLFRGYAAIAQVGELTFPLAWLTREEDVIAYLDELPRWLADAPRSSVLSIVAHARTGPKLFAGRKSRAS